MFSETCSVTSWDLGGPGQRGASIRPGALFSEHPPSPNVSFRFWIERFSFYPSSHSALMQYLLCAGHWPGTRVGDGGAHTCRVTWGSRNTGGRGSSEGQAWGWGRLPGGGNVGAGLGWEKRSLLGRGGVWEKFQAGGGMPAVCPKG